MEGLNSISVRVPIQGEWDDSDDRALYAYFAHDSRWESVLDYAVSATHTLSMTLEWFLAYIHGFWGIVRDQVIVVSLMYEGTVAHITTTITLEQRDGNPLELSRTRLIDMAVEEYRRKPLGRFKAQSSNMHSPFTLGHIPKLSIIGRMDLAFVDWCTHAVRDLIGGPNETPEQRTFRESMEQRSPLYGLRPRSTYDLLNG